ncbi:MAG: glycosyltransferase family A protein [Bacteroidota bacterium]
MNPLISVLTPAYNREKYIGEAIESVQQQTMDEWEMIVIDDGSTDQTVEIVKAYQAKDKRIILLQNTENQGISATRNHGLAHVKGKYIAMLDSDDLCLPQRFEQQFSFLEAHPEIAVLGAWSELIGIKDHQFTPEEKDTQLRLRSLYRCPMVHSSTMIRTSILQAANLRYNKDYPASNDYDFWVRLLPYGQFHNLQTCLVKYRRHDQNISVTNKKDQKKYRAAASRLAFKNVLDWEISAEKHERLFDVLTSAVLHANELSSVEQSMVEMLERTASRPGLDLNYLKKAVFKKLMDAFQNSNISHKKRLEFVRKHQVWKYLPLKTYASVYGKLLLKGAMNKG